MKASPASQRPLLGGWLAAFALALSVVGCGAPQDSAAYREGTGGPAATVGAWTISEAQREAMLNALVDGESHPVWFATDVRDKAAQQYQLELADVFSQAGWEIRSNRPTPFPMKPGLYFFVGGVDPPSYVVSAQAAFDAAGIDVTGGSGYKGYYQEMKDKDPNWQGFQFGEDQTFLVVVGRRPQS